MTLDINNYHTLTNEDFKEDKIIVFSNDLEISKIYTSFNEIFAIEKENDIDISIRFNNISTDKLRELMKFLMKIENIEKITNKSILLNILSLVKSYNTFNDEFFNNESIYFSSIEQYLDVKIDLQEEIINISNKIATYFYSLFRSLSKTEYTILDQYEDIPDFYKCVFLTTNLISLSGILASVPNDYKYDLKYVKGSHLYVSNLLGNYSISSTLMDNFFRGLSNNEKIG